MEIKNQLEKIRDRYFNPSESEIKESGYNFSITSATILKFLPEINVENHFDFYKEILYYQSKAGLEQYNNDLIKTLKINNYSNINDFKDLSVKRSLVFATFHLGSYRLINHYLLNLGLKLVLIIDEAVFNKQAKDLKKLSEHFKNNNSDFIILNVKDRESIFKLKNLLNNGYSLVVYLDGNSGLAKDKDFTKGHTHINFLNHSMYVKNGVQFISKITKAIFIPVVSYFEDDLNQIDFYEPVDFEFDESSKTDYAIEKAYKCLEIKLKKHPTQWECWMYMYKWFDRNFDVIYKEIPDDKILKKFNSKRYSMFELKGSHFFIFDRELFKSIEIDEELYNSIIKNDLDKISLSLLNELKLKNIII